MPPPIEAQLPTGTVTFLFTDIEGSTRILTLMGDRYAGLLARHAEIMRSAISSHGGAEVDTQGDSFFAAFPSAIDALGAAVAAQRGLAATQWPQGATIRVRMGLHTGDGHLGGEGYVGLDVHLAARMAAAGHGGQVLISDATRALIEGSLASGLRLRGLGEHRLKDFGQPMRISQLEIDGLPVDFPSLKTVSARPGNLPQQLTSFVGRESQLADVTRLIGSHRLVTLTGPGGTGKTRVALQTAHELLAGQKDGAFFIDLASIRDATLVPLAVARALGVRVDPGGDALAALQAYLHDRNLLLILDNFEQVREGAGVVEELLSAAPQLKILVTSRTPLSIYGEQEYEVPPFETEVTSSSDAIDLFVDRARAVRPGFELTDEHAAAVAKIITRLDGLPLAIELAAGQVRVLSPAAILSHLDRRLQLLASQARGRPERQRTMRGAIEWSYDLLSEPERRLFARLSACPAGCSLEAAKVVGDPGDLGLPVLEALGGLVGNSLLRQVEEPDGTPRFSMLGTMLEYAGERLEEDFDADATYARMAQFYLQFAEETAPHLTMEEQAIWLDRCEGEGANLRRAFDWAVETGQADIGLRTATALWRFWQLRGPMGEGRRTLDRLLALPGSSPGTRARALGAACGLAWWDGDYELTRGHAEEALRLSREIGDRDEEVEARYNLGRALLWSGLLGNSWDVDRAEDLFVQSQNLAEELGDRRGIAKALRGRGMVISTARGDAGAALPMFERALALLEEVGDRSETADALVALGNGHRFSGDTEGGRTFYLQAIDLADAAGNHPASTGLLFMMAAVEGEMGRHERAATIWGAAMAIREASGALKPPMAARLIGDPVAVARAAIGDDTVERALAAGRVMDADTVIAYAHAG
jgi:predicted ATPase/class 3 adenylate cyclase